MSNHKTDRRKHPRIETSLPLKIAKGDAELVTETKNVSCSGAYCQISKKLPLMSKVMVTLLVPVYSKGKITSKKIDCQGVIVRIQPAEKPGKRGSHNIAIFFTDISKQDRNKIAQYVEFNLLKKDIK